MKIKQIRFRNINSFYGEHPPIQFTDGVLGKTGLFVIAGPTGAGKSTLLDVITLALFNRIPRISDSDGRGLSTEKILTEGLIINKQAANEPRSAAYAEVEYELKGKAYRSRWSMTKNRNGNWNDYEMEMAELPDGKLLSTKKRDVPGLNTDQIGLTYEQFIRSMVLAQGAFDKFLKASSGDRSKLLEQITGTDIYRRLSQRAHVRSREFDELVRDKQREVALIRLLSDEKIAELSAGRTDIEARLKAVEKELKFFRDEAKWVDDARLADAELSALDVKQAQLAEEQRAFAPKAEQLARHERVADLAALLSDLANADVNRRRTAEHERNSRQAVADLQTEFTRLIDRAGALTRQTDLTAETFLGELNRFRDRVLDLTQAIGAERERSIRPLQSIRTTLETAPHDWFRQLNVKNLDQTTQRVAARRQQIGVQLVQLERDHPVAPKHVQAEIERHHAQATQLSALIQLQNQQQERLTQVMELKQKEDERRQFVRRNKPTLQQRLAELEQLNEQKQELDQRKIRLAQEANLGELRKALTAGDPCPLCGSVEHPYAYHYVQQAGTIEMQLRLLTDDINRKKRECDDLNGRVITAEAEGNRLNVQRNDLWKLHSDSKIQISKRLGVITDDADLQVNELEERLQLADVQRKELSQLQALWDEEKRLDRLANDLLTVTESGARMTQLVADKAQLYVDDDVKERCADLTTRFNRLHTDLATQQRLLDQATDARREASERFTLLTDALAPKLAERDLPDADAARAGLLDGPTLRQIREEQRTLADRMLGLSLRRAQEEARKQAAHDARQTDLPAEVVQQRVTDSEKEQRKKIEQLGNVKAQLSANEKEDKRQAKLVNELAKLEAEAMPWRELNRLIGSAKGDEYSRFAQSLTLAQLIGLANRRLRDLSDRYLLLKPRDGQDDLYVLDQYQGGAERTVTSLSGGETFTLSLGLALALSDLASQNVQIDSLFVDEGFGTLDPESLDTAIVMLEKLQQETQKTIGIISHRHEIKERISVQIQVEKKNDGNSRVAVVEL